MIFLTFGTNIEILDPSSIPVSQLSPFNSTTVSNGYLFINSDAGGSDLDGTPTEVWAQHLIL